MKKLLLLLSLSFGLLHSSGAQNIVIPDSIFRNYLITNPAINTNSDTSITVAEAAAFTDTIALAHYHIHTLEGIQYFINIKGLDCQGECCGILGLLRDLDVTQCTKLNYLNCYNNLIHSLDLSHNPDLEVLNSESNPLSTLDLSNNPLLKELYCSSDSLSSINISAALQLQHLHCMNNQLTSLDVTHNNLLKTLYCSYNPLVTINVTNNLSLEEFLCVSDNLNSLDVSKNLFLSYFYCYSNPSLTSICVNSISDASNFETLTAYVKDSTASWSEACKIACIKDIQTAQTIVASPNPSHGQINFNGLKGENTIEVFDLSGRLVYKTVSNDTSLKIDLSGNENGLYSYKISDIHLNAAFGKLILQ